MNFSRRYFAAAVGTSLPLLAHDDDGDPAIDRTTMIHGRTSPLAVAGYRMGDAALRKLKLTRSNAALEVIHYGPATVQWGCIVDGLQASTGASLGQLNLRMVPSTTVYSVIRNRKSGEEVKLELTPEFVKSTLDTPAKNLLVVAEKVSRLPEAQIFRTKS